jgi:pimeloyl-ACP methyl ester carboxylesterase
MPVHPRHANDCRAISTKHDGRRGALSRSGANTLRSTNPNATIRARVGENTVPALLVCGREETRFGPHRDYAQTQMPNLSIVDLAVGHGVNMEDADGFNRALVDFVTGRSR